MQARTSNNKKTFHSVTSVRGLAALAVCWFHTGLWSGLLPEGLLRNSAGFGWLGPHIFFVVSGFVVPWSLYVAGYSWRDAHRYLARRIVRLDPPYFATIVVVLALSFAGAQAGLRDRAFVLDPGQLASHLAYLTEIVGERWYNPVFWTLAVEFQFYLLLGLLFPLLASRRRGLRWGAMLACLAAFAPFFGAVQTVWMIGYLPLFMLGFLLFQTQAGIIGKREMWIWAVPLLLSLISFTYILSLLAFVAFGVMLEDRLRNRVTEFLGRISYSLYLIHMPVGVPFARISQRYVESDLERILVAFAAVLFSIFAAWVFYLLVEKPSVALARRITLHRKHQGESDEKPLAWGLSGAADESMHRP